MRSASLLIGLVGLGSASAAEACRCVRLTPAAAYRQANAVLLGTVREAPDVSAYDRAYRIHVERSWKRQLKGSVSVNSTRSSCLADLRPGEKYLIYVVRDPAGTLRTSACQGNKPADAAGLALAWLAGRK
ncbi:hypothetical protein [Sphingomonas sp. PB4P5]|uniref:hypothetical protein n=1 Tax=Parasphingomonas puruogangriensis TaxID=3096155 RepID=UPI002FC6B372